MSSAKAQGALWAIYCLNHAMRKGVCWSFADIHFLYLIMAIDSSLYNQRTDSTGGSIVPECSLGNGPERGPKTVSVYPWLPVFKETMQTLIRRRVLWRLIWVCTVCQCSSLGFTDNPLYTAFWRHSDRNSAAINNRYLDFVQMHGLILLVNDNHVDNTLKEIFYSRILWVWCTQSSKNDGRFDV